MQELSVSNLTEDIILVEAKQKSLSQAFLRVEEFYESPEFRGKVFTVKQFKAWYKKKKGQFSYYKDWTGFNVPGEIWIKFFDGRFHPLDPIEQSLHLKVKEKIKNRTKFYVIGVSDVEYDATLLHEMVHALFYLSPNYKRAVNRVLNRHRISRLKKYLIKAGYSEGSLTDEMNAYLVADNDYLLKKGIGNTQASVTLKGLFNKYAKKFNLPLVSVR